MGRRGVDVEGPNNGGSVEEVREHLIDLGVLLPVVAFGILFGVCLLKPREKIFRACGRVLKNRSSTRRVEDTTSREMWASEITGARWEVWLTGALSFCLHGRVTRNI
jgi:hypothetical protein